MCCCHCRKPPGAKQGQESAAVLAADANLGTASKASLQNTLQSLEQSLLGSLLQEAEQVVEGDVRLGSGARPGSAASGHHREDCKQLENMRLAVNEAMEQRRQAEEHLHELQEMQHQLSLLASKERALSDDFDMTRIT